ncbi:MAG TPA: methyltransferase domain-containing protein [Acetobacteraceae bacterium]|nr:methyltransferase domain-containing protein [Acetobacteraceae bacterium]
MSGAPGLFDRSAVRRHRERAAALVDRVAPVLGEAAGRLIERLDDTTRRFHRALDLGGRGVVAPLLAARGISVVSADLSPRMAARSRGLAVAADEEFLPFREGAFDLVIANLSLHWANDLPGALIQLRRALEPEGLFLASVPVLGTLDSLRSALTEAEAAISGGASPRVSPFPTLRDCAGLLQRAGFVLPVADLEAISLGYGEALALLHDLRAAGETNAVAVRERRIPPRGLFAAALAALPVREGRISVRLELAMLTGWAP